MQIQSSLSVLCPVFNEANYIASFVESIINQDYPKENLEVLFIDGRSTDETRQIINKYVNKFNYIKLLDNPYQSVSHALNIGIKASSGEIIIRLDAHCKYPDHYFTILVKMLIGLDAENVGGVLSSISPNQSIIAQSISTGISHPFGVGNSLFRIGSDRLMEVDTVPFGCFRRSLFDRIGYFDVDLVRNQDDEFNARIIRNGGKIFLIPDLIITYYARDQFSKVQKMFFQYGLFKPLVVKKIGKFTSLRQVFPAMLIISLVIGFSLGIFFEGILWVAVAEFIVYLLLSVYFTVIEVIKKKNLCLFPFLPYVFFLIHISYGLGYIYGIFKFLILKSKSLNVEVNH